jgi:hypothetical protein
MIGVVFDPNCFPAKAGTQTRCSGTVPRLSPENRQFDPGNRNHQGLSRLPGLQAYPRPFTTAATIAAL